MGRGKARPLPRNLDALASRIRRCTLCGLHRSRTRAVPGAGRDRARVVLVGEAPGREEDRVGEPFRGASGRVLDLALERAGIPRGSTFITNAVKCRPPGNRTPRAGELSACRPYLLAQLEAIRPRVVVALGQTALTSVLGRRAALGKARGTWQALGGMPVLATYHPAAVLRNRRLLRRLVNDLRKAHRRAGER